MSHFFYHLLLFWLEAFGLIAFIFIGLFLLLALTARLKLKAQRGVLSIENMTRDFDEQRSSLEAETFPKKELKKLAKERKQLQKSQKDQIKKRLFVLEFKGDLQAHETTSLAEAVTALLQIAKKEDQVLLKLESPGGLVSAYGLAAAQLVRIRDAGLKLTVAVDQVAASGGYLMAVVADSIIASPFAIIGSIGVLAQMPNFHRLLKKQGIDFEQVTAGEYKRTLTLFGENTPKERKKLKEQLELIHEQFKLFIKMYRPHLDIDKLATGEYWLAKNALELQLIDKLQVSDEFILSAYQQDHEIYKIKHLQKKNFSGKIQELFLALLPKGLLMQ